jgi:integrase
MRILTPNQFSDVLNEVKDTSANALFYLLFWTGMRVGEAKALTPSDYDFSASSVRISKTYRMINGNHIISTPKTQASKRTVILTDDTSDRIQSYISKLFGCSSRTRIFGARSLTWYRKRLIDGCRAAQLDPIRIHDLRHSHASLMIEIGASPLLIAERLGHESVETTLRTYSHLYPNKQRDFIERLNRLDLTL